MIPAGFVGVETQLWIWMVAMLRPGAAFLAAPVFGSANVPVQLRLVIALALGIGATSAAPIALPEDGVASIAGFGLVAGEILAGLALGFAVQIGFAAAMVAGETIGNTMGLGFSAMVDPASGAPTPALGQFLALLATFLFLAIGGHLALAAIIVDSYRVLPPGGAMLAADAVEQMALFGGHVFAAGLVIALPVAFALVLVQIMLGMLARSAPSLNLFAVGLPAALLAGLVLLAMATPVIADALLGSLEAGLAMASGLAR